MAFGVVRAVRPVAVELIRELPLDVCAAAVARS